MINVEKAKTKPKNDITNEKIHKNVLVNKIPRAINIYRNVIIKNNFKISEDKYKSLRFKPYR